MQNNQSIIQDLNVVLTSKLTSINQYFLHARICKDWGLTQLDKVFYKKSIKDMKHSDSLIERVLLLGGLPNLQALGRLKIGENTSEVLACNLTFQNEIQEVIRNTVAKCESAQDYVSRDLLTELLAYEEETLDWLETQQSLIKDISIQNYNQSQVGDNS
jgi:bacterioferritin